MSENLSKLKIVSGKKRQKMYTMQSPKSGNLLLLFIIKISFHFIIIIYFILFSVPKVLTQCTNFIENHGIVDGIYRVSGIGKIMPQKNRT